MPKTFFYKMKSVAGQTVYGSITAENEQEVAAYIREKGHYAIKIKEKEQSFLEKVLTYLGWVDSKEMAIFCRQFAAMADAGIPLMENLQVLIEQTKNAKLKAALKDICMRVKKGEALSKGMSVYPGIFPEFMINMVASAETGGTVDIIMSRLSVHFEKEYKLKEKIRTALAYPLAVVVFSIISLSIILTFVLPSFVNMFETMQINLPWPTLVLVQISNFLQDYYWNLAAVVIAAVCLGTAIYRQPQAKRIKDSLIFYLPVFGSLQQKAAIARFSRSLATLVKGGVSIVKSIEIAKNTFGHHLMTEALDKARESVVEGRGLTLSLEESRVFPPMVTQMVAVGEKTGELDKMLEKIADFYDSEVDDMLLRLSSLLEPMLIGVLGLVVGLIILAVMLPVFEMITLIN